MDRFAEILATPAQAPRPSRANCIDAIVAEATTKLDSSTAPLIERMRLHATYFNQCLAVLTEEDGYATVISREKSGIKQSLARLISIAEQQVPETPRPGMKRYLQQINTIKQSIDIALNQSGVQSLDPNACPQMPPEELIDSEMLEQSFPTFQLSYITRSQKLIIDIRENVRMLSFKSLTERQSHFTISRFQKEFTTLSRELAQFTSSEQCAPGHTFAPNLPLLAAQLLWLNKTLQELIATPKRIERRKHLLTDEFDEVTAETFIEIQEPLSTRIYQGVRTLTLPVAAGIATFFGSVNFRAKKDIPLQATDYVSIGIVAVATSVATYTAPMLFQASARIGRLIVGTGEPEANQTPQAVAQGNRPQ
ncbi:MAG: hypothetical protein V4490_00285 [Pseudomonadota bacterium]